MIFLSLLEFSLKVKDGCLMLTDWPKYHIFISYYCKHNKMASCSQNFLFTGINIFLCIHTPKASFNIEKNHFGYHILLVSLWFISSSWQKQNSEKNGKKNFIGCIWKVDCISYQFSLFIAPNKFFFLLSSYYETMFIFTLSDKSQWFFCPYWSSP